MILSFVLSLIHSQIVATKSGKGNGTKCKQISKTKVKHTDRVRKRKKILKNRQEVGKLHNIAISERKSKLMLDLPSRKSYIKWDLRRIKGEENCFDSNENQSNQGNDTIDCDEIEQPVQEFYYNLVDNIVTEFPNDLEENKIDGVLQLKEDFQARVDDDGFESFYGKSSSSEEIILCDNVEKIVENSSVRNLTEKSSDTNEIRQRKIALASNKELGKRKSPVLESTSIFESNVKNESDSDEDIVFPDGGAGKPKLSSANYKEGTTSAAEWLGITTNSEECSYSSEMENSDYQHKNSFDDNFTPTVILNPINRINCTVWDRREAKKAEMSVLDISSCIIERVDSMPDTCDYMYIGIFFSIMLSFVPSFCRLCEATVDAETEINYLDLPILLLEKASFSVITVFGFAFGETTWETTVLLIGFIQRLNLTFILFFLLAVAEKTFKQRFLYAKLFSHLTSSRRARRSNLPHFRLNKVINIKTWLSVRSYLKRRGPQRSVDIIVSAAFIITLLLLAFLSVEWLKDSVQMHSQFNLESLLWSSALGIFLLRFMTLGNKINRKYKSISVLITEQINLYLQIEQKPKKKDELMVSNSVLKLAGDLLKELDSPFKISGLSANPYLYTTIKVVILSALSGVLSEMLGFKLKLHKIKIK